MLREESLLASVANTEGFLASLGMTEKAFYTGYSDKQVR
jgi:hypothetical protein